MVIAESMGDIMVPVAFHTLCQLIWADIPQSGLADTLQSGLAILM